MSRRAALTSKTLRSLMVLSELMGEPVFEQSATCVELLAHLQFGKEAMFHEAAVLHDGATFNLYTMRRIFQRR